MRANAPSRASQAPSLLDRDYTAAPTARVSESNRLTTKSAASIERVLLWAFIAGLAWCPFWFGGAVLLCWGINAVLFRPGCHLRTLAADKRRTPSGSNPAD